MNFPVNLPDTFRSNRSLFSDFFRDLDDLFSLSPMMQSSLMPSGLSESFLNPVVDLEEGDDHYALVFEIPGVRQEDLKVDLTNNMLTVSGERRQEIGDEGKKISGRRYGSFRRSFSLPSGTNVDDVKAHYENGVLEIVIPKSAEGQRKNIQIQQGRAASRDVLTGSKGQEQVQAQSQSQAQKQSEGKGAASKSAETQPRH